MVLQMVILHCDVTASPQMLQVFIGWWYIAQKVVLIDEGLSLKRY
jgi:hypothetical protein